MSTKNKWLLGIGIAIGLVVLFFLPSMWQALFPAQGFGMMGQGFGMMGHGNVSMMNNAGFSHMRGGGMMGYGTSFLWLIPLTLLTLVGLSIAALIKYLRTPTA